MNRLGILIDLSHVGPRTTMDAIEASQKPVVFTHANPSSLCDHPRNKSDAALKAVAAKGGVVGATIFPPFLPAGNKSTLNDYIDVIDYMADMIGHDHIAVGTDFTEGQPEEWFDWILTGNLEWKNSGIVSHAVEMNHLHRVLMLISGSNGIRRLWRELHIVISDLPLSTMAGETVIQKLFIYETLCPDRPNGTTLIISILFCFLMIPSLSVKM